MFRKFFFVQLLVSLTAISALAQDFVEDLIINTDSSHFTLKENSVNYRRSSYLYFVQTQINEVLHIKVIPKSEMAVTSVTIVPTSNIEVVDPLLKIEDGSYTGSIRMVDAINNPNNRLVLKASLDSTEINR